MPELKIKFVGIKDLAEKQGIEFVPYPLTFFDLNNFQLNSRLIHAFKPALAVLKSGWIIDGNVVVTDEGMMLGEGFTWHTSGYSPQFRSQNEKLNVSASANTLSITGFKDEKGECDIIREISKEKITNSFFLSGFDNLSHFMMEIAPKSLLFSKILEQAHNIKNVSVCSLVPRKWIDYTIETAESVNSKHLDLTVKQFNPDKAVRFKSIIVITSITHRGSNNEIRMSVKEAKSFSQQMCKNATFSSNKDPYILYLSRKNAAHRRTVNQDNLVKIVKKNFPKFEFILENEIHKLSMKDQAMLIYNASLIIEEAGGSTGFTNNLLNDHVPYVCIISTQRENTGGKLYLAGLDKYASWILGKPVGKLTESTDIDNDIQVEEKEFEEMLVRLAFLIDKKIFMPKYNSIIKPYY